jgi:LysM repeat protein
MKPPTQRNTLMMILLLAAMALAACTRSASSGVVPTPTTPPQGVAGGGEPQATDAMNALGTALALQITQTAQAAGVGGTAPGGETPTPTALTGGLATPTAAPPAGATPVPATGGSCSNPYTVKQGDWIFKIARDCRVEPSAIIAANPGISPDRISPGQKLNMPAAGATAVPPATPQSCTGTHTVVQGENLFRIAYNCGLTTEQLAGVNGVKFPYIIHPGDVLRFP